MFISKEDWKAPDPKEMKVEEFDKIRDLIESKVIELLSRIQANYWRKDAKYTYC